MKYNAKKVFDRFLKSSLSKQEELELDLFEKEMMYHNSNKVFRGEQHEKQIEYEMLSKITSERKKLRTIYKVMAVASIVLLFITVGTSYFISNKYENPIYTEAVNNTKANQTYILSDGSKITLKSGSKISYNEEFNIERREIELYGEAFFDVERNEEKPFIITTGKLKTEVLGTSFNIKESNSEIKVTVVSGLVKVYDTENTIRIKPNQQAKYNIAKNDLSKHNINSAFATLWFKDRLRLKEITLKELGKYFQERYGIVMHIENVDLESKKITTTISKNDNIETIIKRINNVKEFKLTKSKNNILKVSAK